jgi:hypothetical protein
MFLPRRQVSTSVDASEVQAKATLTIDPVTLSGSSTNSICIVWDYNDSRNRLSGLRFELQWRACAPAVAAAVGSMANKLRKAKSMRCQGSHGGGGASSDSDGSHSTEEGGGSPHLGTTMSGGVQHDDIKTRWAQEGEVDTVAWSTPPGMSSSDAQLELGCHGNGWSGIPDCLIETEALPSPARSRNVGIVNSRGSSSTPRSSTPRSSTPRSSTPRETTTTTTSGTPRDTGAPRRCFVVVHGLERSHGRAGDVPSGRMYAFRVRAISVLGEGRWSHR